MIPYVLFQFIKEFIEIKRELELSKQWSEVILDVESKQIQAEGSDKQR